jgi:heme/copper-type cytochrome/quinol oxidase subunit 2
MSLDNLINFLLDKISFQEPATANMFSTIYCHNTIMFYSFIILTIILIIIGHIVMIPELNTVKLDSFNRIVLYNYISNKIQKWFADSYLESFRTDYPPIVIIFIIIPVLIYLFAFEELELDHWNIVVKIIGNQWFWSYELVNSSFFSSEMFLTKLDFESRLLDDNSTIIRLLDVDETLFLPINKVIHLLITSSDVIHSWSVPALGIKVDAVPGRINYANFTLTRPGVFYGQCSELCGINHGFMPIKIIGFRL